MARLRENYLTRIGEQLELDRRLSLFSPFSLVKVMLDHVAESGWSRRSSFLRQLNAYQRTYTRFVAESRERYRSQAAISSMRAEITDSDGEVYSLEGIGGISYADVDFDERSELSSIRMGRKRSLGTSVECVDAGSLPGALPNPARRPRLVEVSLL